MKVLIILCMLFITVGCKSEPAEIACVKAIPESLKELDIAK